MPRLAEGLPSWAALKGLPIASKKAPFRNGPASPRAIGLSRGGGIPGPATGTITARSLRGSAAMISASNRCRSAARTLSLAAPRTTWNAVRICPSVPTTTPEPKSNEIWSEGSSSRLNRARGRPGSKVGPGRFLPRTACVSCGLSPFSR